MIKLAKPMSAREIILNPAGKNLYQDIDIEGERASIAHAIKGLVTEMENNIKKSARELDGRALFVKEMNGSMSRLHNCEMQEYADKLKELAGELEATK